MIRLNKKYVLSADTYSFALQEVKVSKKSKEEYLEAVSYHRTIESLLKAIAEREIKLKIADSKELKGLVQYVSTYMAEIEGKLVEVEQKLLDDKKKKSSRKKV